MCQNAQMHQHLEGVNSPDMSERPARPVVFVFRMPKVGSSTVYHSLKHAGTQLRVLKSHLLSQNGLTYAIDYWRGRGGRLPHDLRHSIRLRRLLDAGYPGRWKVITLVRDPVAREISEFFHHLPERQPELLSSAPSEQSIESAVSLVQVYLSGYPDGFSKFAAQWFDNELAATFGINVRGYPFDKSLGYVRIQHPRADLLVLRLEDLNRCFNPVIPSFLGLDGPIEMRRDNIGSEKPYAGIYRAVLERLSVPKDVSARICRAPWARHFYSLSERDRFIERWASPEGRTPREE
jgi:Putative capsular polysaccharide synthesis protein